MFEDRTLECSKPDRRFQAELVSASRPDLLIHGEGLDLTALSGQREHQQAGQPFLERAAGEFGLDR